MDGVYIIFVKKGIKKPAGVLLNCNLFTTIAKSPILAF